MTRVSVCVVGLSLTMLSACSSVAERKIANGNFDYIDEPEAKSFDIPADVDKPFINNAFAVPDLGENAAESLVGPKVTVVSPALVLPLVSGSRVEEGLKEATVYFDQVDDSQPLDQTIWNSLIGFLEEQGIGVVSFDKEQQKLVTDWMIAEDVEDSSWFNWTSTERSVGRRFEFNLDVKHHGRTAALKAELKDYLETVGEEVIADLESEQERRNEVDILNKVINHYENQLRIADVKRIRQIRDGLEMELGFNSNGEPAYVVDGDYDVVWTRLLLVLRKLGFNVKDLDKSNGLLFVNYGSAESGWWDSLWGSGDDELDLDKEDYRFQVENVGRKTSISLLDDESNPFPANKVTELYDTFARTMAADDLDI